MKIFLVRHAHAVWVPDEDRPLSVQGFHAAQELANQLSAHPIAAVYSSPYRRAVQTVQPLAERLGLEIKVEDRFRERALGKIPDIPFEEAVRQTWLDFDFAYPRGESNAQAQRRAIQALEALLQVEKAAQVVISTHGNLLALILNHYNPAIGYDFWSRLDMPDVVELEAGS